MIEFTTSKGEFIAVPTDGQIHAIEFEYEAIGFSSDILKDEELAKKVAEPGFSCLACKIIFNDNNITGNQLIIEKK
jgi:hypothetical protein